MAKRILQHLSFIRLLDIVGCRVIPVGFCLDNDAEQSLYLISFPRRPLATSMVLREKKSIPISWVHVLF